MSLELIFLFQVKSNGATVHRFQECNGRFNSGFSHRVKRARWKETENWRRHERQFL